MNVIVAEISTSTLIARVVIVIAALALWHFTQHLLGKRGTIALNDDGSIRDGMHVLMNPWYQRLLTNPRAADALLLTSSLIIDLLALYVLGLAVFGSTIQPFLGMLIVFALRQVCQALCPLPAPVGMIWRNPGFPTLMVTYKTENDFFFSGHTAMAIFGTVCLANMWGPVGVVLGLLIAIYEIGVVLVLRAHYTMDVFAGAITALYAYHLSSQLAPTVDGWISQLVSLVH